MIDERQHLLLLLSEECSEIAEQCNRLSIRVSKALRFGEGEIQPGQLKDNLARIVAELTDLRAVIEILTGQGVIREEACAVKKIKIDAFLRYSRELGSVEE